MTVREEDFVLQCPCGGVWVKLIELPMNLDDLADELLKSLTCPSCGVTRAPNDAKQIHVLTGEARRNAIVQIYGGDGNVCSK